MASSTIAVRLTAIDPPADCFGGLVPLLLGVQRSSEVEQVVELDGDDVGFEAFIDVHCNESGAVVDTRGPYVHGRPGQRFLYLVWGHPELDSEGRQQPDGADFVLFARAKLLLADVPEPTWTAALTGDGATLSCRMEAADARSQPASGSVRPPHVVWSSNG